MTNDNLLFYEKMNPKIKVNVFGVPIDLGKDGSGSNAAPDYLREQGLMEMFVDIGFLVEDMGNLACGHKSELEMGNPKTKFLKEIVRVAQETARITFQEVSAQNKVVAIGGDQCVSFGTIAGASAACKGDLGVIWIDVHADLMTHENTLSGNVHGMPASAAMGMGHPDLVNIFQPGAKVAKENFLFIGLKDMDQDEINLIRSENLNAITIMDLLQKGFGHITKAVDELNKRVKNVWICLDLDGIEKNDAPATLMGANGSLNYREVTNLAKYIGRKCNVVGMDVSEIVPEMDIDNKTAKLSLELISYFLGADYSWYARYMKKAAEKLKY
mgnify:FL=1